MLVSPYGVKKQADRGMMSDPLAEMVEDPIVRAMTPLGLNEGLDVGAGCNV
jgi:hypothetical protein